MTIRATPILPNPSVDFCEFTITINGKDYRGHGKLTRDGRAFLQAMVNAMVIGPTSATDGAAVLFDGTSGQKVKE